MTEYQCPQCLWTGTEEDMEQEARFYRCPTCKVAFNPNTWEVWDEDV